MVNYVGYQVQLFDAVDWVIDKKNGIGANAFIVLR